MRLIKVKTPEGRGTEVVELALRVGIAQVGVYAQQVHSRERPVQWKDVVDIETATPLARRFVDALLEAPFYDPAEYSFSVRDARTIASQQPPQEVTRPIVEPPTDVLQELWQFTHVTPSFAARVLVGSSLLAFGMVADKLLFMIAGLLFLPFLPVLLATGFGLLTGQWRMVVSGVRALAAELVLAVAAGAAVASLAEPPLRFHDFTPLGTAVLFSLAIGVAAGFATTDDSGWRQLIGLAAASQIALIPVWFGIALVFGFADPGAVPASERLAGFGLSLITIPAAALGTYAVLGMRGAGLRRYTRSNEERPGQRIPRPRTEHSIGAT
jgi:hypothetical protein